MNRCTLHKFGVVAALSAAFFAGPSRAQDVSSPMRHDSTSADGRTPRGALWRAALVPGWGQIYNRHYVKLPFVYGAIGGLVYLAIRIDGNYRDYRRAYLYKAYQERVDSGVDQENKWARYKPSYDAIANKYGQISSSPLRTQRDAYRRNRDLSILGAGLVYALTVLDAYVSAHLLDFDVGENLSMNVEPVPFGVGLRARWSFP